MDTKPDATDALTALQHITLEEVKKRLAEIDGERASLSLLKRSLTAKERARLRATRVTEGRRDV